MQLHPQQIFLRILGIIFFIGVAVIGYLGFSKYNQGAIIENVSISDGITVDKSHVDISGVFVNVHRFSINDRNTPINKDRTFKEKVTLTPGLNTISLRVFDVFENSTEYRYTIYSTMKNPEYRETYQQILEAAIIPKEEDLPDTETLKVNTINPQ